jgi:hypothetical protein
MALSIATHLNTKILDSTDGSISVTTGSYTSVNNSLLVAVVGVLTNDTSTSSNIATANSAMTGWTKRVSIDQAEFDAAYSGCLEMWTKAVATGGSETATWTNSVTTTAGSFDPVRVAFQIFSLTGYDTGTPTGATATDSTLGTSGTGALTLSGSPATSSMVIAARMIHQNGTTNITGTPGSGWTEIYDHDTVAGSEGYACLNTQQRTGSTSTAVAWTEINANGQSAFGEAVGLALEIVAATGGDVSAALTSSVATTGRGTPPPVISIEL